METLSKEMAIRLHRMQWGELAEKGCNKKDLSIWKHNGGLFSQDYVNSFCFLCEYCNQNGALNPCTACPLDILPNCFSRDSLWKQWENISTETPFWKKQLAAQLRDYGLDTKSGRSLRKEIKGNVSL